MFTELKRGQIVISKRGHDKGNKMVVLNIVDKNSVRVVDGKTRKIQKAKLKKNKHLQAVGQFIDLEPVNTMKDPEQANAYIRKSLNHI